MLPEGGSALTGKVSSYTSVPVAVKCTVAPFVSVNSTIMLVQSIDGGGAKHRMSASAKKPATFVPAVVKVPPTYNFPPRPTSNAVTALLTPEPIADQFVPSHRPI